MGNHFCEQLKYKQRNSIVLLSVLFLFACHPNYFSSKSGNGLPAPVAQSFFLKYPDAEIQSLTRGSDALAIHFTKNGRQVEAIFSNEGRWIETITKIKWTSQLPSEVKIMFLETPYASWNVTRINKCESPNDSSYRLDVNNGNLLDADRHDSFLQACLLKINVNGTVSVRDSQ